MRVRWACHEPVSANGCDVALDGVYVMPCQVGRNGLG